MLTRNDTTGRWCRPKQVPKNSLFLTRYEDRTSSSSFFLDCINNSLPNILATQRLPVGNLLFTFYATAMLWLHRGQRKPQNQRETIKNDTDSYFKDFILPGRYAITVLNLHSLCNNSYDATHNFFINHSYPVEK